MAASTYYNDNLCSKIKQKRIELGLTTEEAAHLAGIETKIWERYEAGRPIRTEKRGSICKVLGWSKLPGEDEIALGILILSDSDMEQFMKLNKRRRTSKAEHCSAFCNCIANKKYNSIANISTLDIIKV